MGPSWGYVGLCWPILVLCWPILRAIWAHLRAMLAHLGAMLAHLGPILGLGWPILGLCWPILRPMLVTHLQPQSPKKCEKIGNSKKHHKTRVFLGTRGGRRQGRRPPSPSERRDDVRQGHVQLRAPRASGKEVWLLDFKNESRWSKKINLNNVASTAAKNTPKSRHGSPKHGSQTGKHHASEGRRSYKESPKKCL